METISEQKAARIAFAPSDAAHTYRENAAGESPGCSDDAISWISLLEPKA